MTNPNDQHLEKPKEEILRLAIKEMQSQMDKRLNVENKVERYAALIYLGTYADEISTLILCMAQEMQVELHKNMNQEERNMLADKADDLCNKWLEEDVSWPEA